MFYSHAEKVRIAVEVLASCQAEDGTAGYRRICAGSHLFFLFFYQYMIIILTINDNVFITKH